MTYLNRYLVWLSLAMLSIAVPTRAADTTVPSATNSPNAAARRPGPYVVVQRIRRAVDQLTLTDAQKSKVADILNQASQQAQDLSQSMTDVPPQNRFQKLTDFAKQIRGQLANVLTPDQMKSLQEQVGNGPASPGGGMLELFSQAVAKLDLTEDQKQQVADLMTSTRQKIADLRQHAAGGDDVQADLKQVRQDVRAKLMDILTPDQMQTLLQTVQQLREARGGGDVPGKPPINAQPHPNQQADQSAPPQPKLPADIQAATLNTGSPVPDVKLYELNGPTFDPAKYKGRVIVLEFGSLSCPIFRDQVKQMEQLRAAESTRAFFMIVYTREAFPSGDKDVLRNREQGFSVPQANSFDERKMEANLAREKLGIAIPIAVDSMNDAASTAFGAFPNGAVVIGKDGNIAAYQQWTNPDTLRTEIDDAAQSMATMGH